MDKLTEIDRLRNALADLIQELTEDGGICDVCCGGDGKHVGDCPVGAALALLAEGVDNEG